jgi:transcription elongation factor GreA
VKDRILKRFNDQIAALERELKFELPKEIARARELGDLRENAEYQEARREQSFVEGRIQALEALLRSAVVVEGRASDGTVAVGSSVVVEMDGEQSTWVIVGSNEADPARGRISYGSPVGQAMLGRRAGDEVVAQLPRGELRLRLLEVS